MSVRGGVRPRAVRKTPALALATRVHGNEPVVEEVHGKAEKSLEDKQKRFPHAISSSKRPWHMNQLSCTVSER